MNKLTTVLQVVACALAASLVNAQAEPPPASTNSTLWPSEAFTVRPAGIWLGQVGDGFRRRTQSVGVELGAAPGLKEFGSTQSHDLALASLSYGCIVGHLKGEGHWYRGNWEVRADLFGGAQYSPTTEWFIGLTPHLRYNFDTGTRWIPFIDGGIGPSATGIRRPDLGSTFEFNDQVNAGIRWFMRDDVAFTAEVGAMHISNAGISQPNNGVNTVKGMAGISWFF